MIKKLHLGCGARHFDGYVNIDNKPTDAADVFLDILELPYKDNSIERIESYHVLEHFPVELSPNTKPFSEKTYEAIINVLKEWRRVLEPGGKIIIEVPDFDAVVTEYVEADEARKEELLIAIFGAYRGCDDKDTHRWGVNKKRLQYVLYKAGFREIKFCPAQDYHTETCPCLRAEAVK